MASDEGERVPVAAPAPPKQTPAQAAPAAPAPKLAFERWAVEKFGVVFSDRGRASGVTKGKRVRKDGTRNAALINAARSHHRIPLGKTVTEDEFNQLLDATSALEVR
jgi:hypothetical protein